MCALLIVFLSINLAASARWPLVYDSVETGYEHPTPKVVSTIGGPECPCGMAELQSGFREKQIHRWMDGWMDG